MSAVEWLQMGVLISTSSIALQKAIHDEVIPEISDILMDWGIIREPIISVLRKGRSHHICEYNLNEYLPFINDDDMVTSHKSRQQNNEDGKLHKRRKDPWEESRTNTTNHLSGAS
jgi:hypothetical protein